MLFNKLQANKLPSQQVGIGERTVCSRQKQARDSICVSFLFFCYLLCILMLPLSCSAVGVTVEYGALNQLNYVDAGIPLSGFSGTTVAVCADSCNSKGTGCRGFAFNFVGNVCTLFTAGAPGAPPTTAERDLVYNSAIQAVNGIAVLPQTKVAGSGGSAYGPYDSAGCQALCLANPCVYATFQITRDIFGTCTLYFSGFSPFTVQSLGEYTTFIKANANYTTL